MWVGSPLRVRRGQPGAVPVQPVRNALRRGAGRFPLLGHTEGSTECLLPHVRQRDDWLQLQRIAHDDASACPPQSTHRHLGGRLAGLVDQHPAERPGPQTREHPVHGAPELREVPLRLLEGPLGFAQGRSARTCRAVVTAESARLKPRSASSTPCRSPRRVSTVCRASRNRAAASRHAARSPQLGQPVRPHDEDGRDEAAQQVRPTRPAGLPPGHRLAPDPNRLRPQVVGDAGLLGNPAGDGRQVPYDQRLVAEPGWAFIVVLRIGCALVQRAVVRRTVVLAPGSTAGTAVGHGINGTSDSTDRHEAVEPALGPGAGLTTAPRRPGARGEGVGVLNQQHLIRDVEGQQGAVALFRSASRPRCSRSQAPAFCHRSRRRQHVRPVPNSSSND